MKAIYFLMILLIMILIGCEEKNMTSNDEGKIVWTQERLFVNDSFMEIVRRFIISRDAKGRGRSVAVETLLNTSEKAIYSIDCFDTAYNEKCKSAIGYFIIDSTKCFLFSGLEPLYSKDRSVFTEGDFSGEKNDDMRYIRLLKKSGKAELIMDGEQEYWELEHIRESRK